LFEDLMETVYLFLDWQALATIIQEQDAELVWSSFKDDRQQQAKPLPQRYLTIGGRIPRVCLQNGYCIEGFSKIYRIYWDGITPSAIAAQYVELLRTGPHLPSKAAPHDHGDLRPAD